MSIFILGSSTGGSEIEVCSGFDRSNHKMFLEENLRKDCDEVLANWNPINFKLQYMRKKGAFLKDAYGVATYDSINLIVSANFRDIVEENFSGQCTFLPVSIKGVNIEYFALWVNNTKECALNESESDISYYKSGLRNIFSYSFDETKLDGQSFFRLPWIYMINDLVSSCFLAAAQEAGLRGLSFWNRNTREAGQKFIML